MYSATVNQQPKRSQNSGRLRMGLLLGRSRKWGKIRRVQIKIVRLWIESHCFGPELSLDSLDHAELIGRVFVEDMRRALARCCKHLAHYGIIGVRVHMVAYLKCLNQSSAVRIHN